MKCTRGIIYLFNNMVYDHHLHQNNDSYFIKNQQVDIV